MLAELVQPRRVSFDTAVYGSQAPDVRIGLVRSAEELGAQIEHILGQGDASYVRIVACPDGLRLSQSQCDLFNYATAVCSDFVATGWGSVPDPDLEEVWRNNASQVVGDAVKSLKAGERLVILWPAAFCGDPLIEWIRGRTQAAQCI